MICQPCRDGVHSGLPTFPQAEGAATRVCPGVGQCECQHRAPARKADPGCGAVDAEHGKDPCGITPSRLYACGYRCGRHRP